MHQVEGHDGEVAAPGNRPMTFEEKRRLSQGLGSLPADKLGVVMEIIAEHQHIEPVGQHWVFSVRCTDACGSVLQTVSCQR